MSKTNSEIEPPKEDMRVSAIITCYNEGAYISATVKSVLNQTRQDIIDRIIIVDDGSAAETIAVLKEIENLDPRIKIIYGPGGVGLPGQRRIAIAETDAPFFAILDGDDLWAEEKLEFQLNFLAKDPEVGLIYSDFYTFPDGDLSAARRAGVLDISGAQDLPIRYFLQDPPIIPSTTLIRRSAYEACGGFDAAVRVFEDTDFYIRLSGVTRFGLVDRALLYKRNRNTSITGGRNDLMAHHAFVAFRAATHNPRLLPHIPARLSERARKLANQRFLARDFAGARLLSDFALRLRPTQPSAVLSYVLCRLPEYVADRLIKTVFAKRAAVVVSVKPDAAKPKSAS